jgi:hypothetical protein
MKHHLKRTLITLLTAALLLSTASCGKRDSWLPFGEKKSSCEKAYESLEGQFKDLKATVTGGKTSADRAAFWQATAALFIVLSVFALVGGAALGSRARRDRERFRQSATTEGNVIDNPEEFTV